jgi:hypothetical protein
LPFRKVLLLAEAEVVEQIEEVQEVEMEVEEEVDSLAAVTTASKDIRAVAWRYRKIGKEQRLGKSKGLVSYKR